MHPDQFVVFIQMMDAIRYQIGPEGKQPAYPMYLLAESTAEEACNNAKFLAAKAHEAAHITKVGPDKKD